MSVASSDHQFSFFRVGGFDQVRIESGADLLALRHLDQKLWVALACPSTGLEFDAKTLSLIDTDGDGRIRAPEVLDAIHWAKQRLKSMDSLMAGAPALPLSAIDENTEEGKALLASARQILKNLGREGETSIRPEDTSDSVRLFVDTAFNGDGVVPEHATDEAPLVALIGEIMKCGTPATDRSGKPGITRPMLEEFFAQAQAHVAWWDQADAEGVLPLGDATGPAADAIAAVASKIEDYFARCRLAAFDPRAIEALNRQESEYLAVAAQDLSITTDEVAGLPLARVAAKRALPLRDGINPAWAAPMAALVAKAVTPLLGSIEELSEAAWADLRSRFAAYQAWRGTKAGAEVEALGLPRLREILASDGREGLEALIAADEALAPEAAAIDGVTKLVHLHRDLVTLVRNFVNFEQFYDPSQRSIFQAGTLYLDQRSCDLVLRVSHAGRHASLAGLSRAYLAYCDCVRKGSTAKLSIVAAFTDGDTDNLMVGRNGVFYDRNGDDWDATITKIVENPISVRQAFWMPYKRVLRTIEAQITKRAEAADKASDAKLESARSSAGNAVVTGATGTEAPPLKGKFDVGVVAALGVAVGGIVAALGAVLQVFFGLGIWMPIGIVGLILVISGPSMFIAALKLRQRNLGPLLDANGWAVNAMAKINIPFGESLTGVASLPAGSRRDLSDPYAQKSKGARYAIFAIILVVMGLLWWSGALDSALPSVMDRETVLGAPGLASPPAPVVAPDASAPAAP